MIDHTRGWQQKKLAGLRAELVALEMELVSVTSGEFTQATELATELHKLTCHWNHTDGCGWFYENDWDTDHTHKEYLKKAQNILKECDFETALKTIKLAQVK